MPCVAEALMTIASLQSYNTFAVPLYPSCRPHRCYHLICSIINSDNCPIPHIDFLHYALHVHSHPRGSFISGPHSPLYLILHGDGARYGMTSFNIGSYGRTQKDCIEDLPRCWSSYLSIGSLHIETDIRSEMRAHQHSSQRLKSRMFPSSNICTL